MVAKSAALGVAVGAFIGFGVLPRVLAAVPTPTGTPALGAKEVEYLIEGTFGTNTGPNQKGYWKVRSYWNYDEQRWTFWDVFLYSSGAYGNSTNVFPDGTLVERMSSLNFNNTNCPGEGVLLYSGPNCTGTATAANFLTGPSADSAYVSLASSVNQDSGCFGSPNQKGPAPNGSTFRYYEAGVGSAYCDASNGNTSPLNSTTTDYLLTPTDSTPQNNTRLAGVFAVVQDENHFIYNGGGFTATHSYFRLPLILQPGGFGKIGGPTNKFILADSKTQAEEWFGWGVMVGELAADPGIGNTAATDCVSGNSFPVAASSCPYAGNNINNQGLSGTATLRVNVNNNIPAPLPAAGLVPLGVALRKLSSRRRQLLACRSVAKV